MLPLRRPQSLALIFLYYLISNTYAANKRVLCYYAEWSEERNNEYRLFPKDIDATLCTHLVYAFLMPDLNDGIVPLDFLDALTEGGYEEFSKLKVQNPDLKLIMSVGGWNEGSLRFSKITSDPEKRKWFAQYSCLFIRSVNFDGLEINWQWPGLREGSNSADKENLSEFLKEIKRYYVWEGKNTNRSRLLISVVLPPLLAIASKGFEVNALTREADYLNLLTMEYHTSTDPLINNPAPLFELPDPDFNKELTVDHTVKMYLAMNIDPNKINLGIPLYGHSYLLESSIARNIGSRAEDEGTEGFGTKTPGTLAYYEICKYIKDGWAVEHPNKTAMGPYAFQDTNWVAYDDVDIIKKKVQYAIDKGLGGVMLWTIDQDDFNGICNQRFPLTRAARQAVNEAPEVTTITAVTDTALFLYAGANGGNKISDGDDLLRPKFGGSSDRDENANSGNADHLLLAGGEGTATNLQTYNNPSRNPQISIPQPQNSGTQTGSQNVPPKMSQTTTPKLPRYIPPPTFPPQIPILQLNPMPYAPLPVYYNYNQDGWMLNNIFRTNQSFQYKRNHFRVNKNTYYYA